MWRPRIDAGSSFFISGSLVSTVVGHRLIEAIGAPGKLGSTYGTYRHVALTPAVICAVLAALLASFALAGERRRDASFGRSDGLVRDALGISEIGACRASAIFVCLQFGLLYAMETLEHALAFGTPSTGLDWLGGDPLLAIAVHLSLALAVSYATRRVSRSLLDACDRFIALVDRLVSSLRGLLERSARPRAAVRSRRVHHRISRSAHRLGLRAPPTAI